jgi:indole-3-glycerol phosphate synthase
VLRKDFIIDPIQIEEARIHGADAILLIAAILDQVQIKEFKDIAAEAGMDSLVEVHDEDELEKALAAEPDIIGINNRNLNDFSVDLNTTFRLKKLIPETIAIVSESGLRSEDDLQALMDGGITAALIGESLMRAGSESPLLSQLRV